MKREAEEQWPPRRPPPPRRGPPHAEGTGVRRDAGDPATGRRNAGGLHRSRAGRIQTNFQEGNRSLEKQDFPLALARFQLVERDQKDYQGVEALITDTTAKQQKAVEEAMENGRRNEAGNKFADALKWYQAALRFDPSAAGARDKVAALTERVTKDGLDALHAG